MPYPLYYVSCFPLALDYSLVFINYYLFSLFHITLSLYYITLNRMSCSLVFPLSFPFILYPFIYNNPTGNRYLVTFFPLLPIILAFYVVISSSIFLIIPLSPVILSSLFSIALLSYTISLPLLYLL